MKSVAIVLGTIEWAIALGVSYFLLQFGAERVSHWVAARYVYGSADSVEPWLTFLGLCAFVATFLLIHPRTRWYSAALLTVVLAIASLNSLSFGEPEPLLIPILGLGSALVVLFSHRPNRAKNESELDCARAEPRCLSKGM